VDTRFNEARRQQAGRAKVIVAEHCVDRLSFAREVEGLTGFVRREHRIGASVEFIEATYQRIVLLEIAKGRVEARE
jgi:hypothetical protein